MVGPRRPIMHWLTRIKACVDIKNGQLKVIKAEFSSSRRPIHNVVFEVGFYFRAPTITFSCLALDHTLPRLSTTPLQIK
jgi:hypothetical protein